MNERRIPWWEPRIGDAELSYVTQALDRHFPNIGPLTEQFERQVAERLGVAHAVAVTSGTMALVCALKAWGIGPGDEVIVPDMTFIATANAVDLCGGRVVLVDIDPATLNIDPAAVLRAITPKTKAIIPVHVSGRGADMDAIMRIAEVHHLGVVEDAAEAFMSRSNGRMLGTIGHAGCFSFSAYKTITSGQGGMIVTNDAALAEKMRGLRDQGRTTRGTGGDDLHPTIGYNFKYTDVQAGVALGQMALLDERLERARRTREIYGRELSDVPGVHLYPFDLAHGETPQWSDARLERRDDAERFLKERNIDGRRFWHPLHRQEPYKHPDAEFPHSSVAAPASFWLPSAFTLSDEDIMMTCQALKEFYGHV